MSKLEELIQELCPDGVEYKTLGELCNTITTGKLNANAMVENGEYPFYTCDSTPYRIDKYAFDEESILISGNGSQVGHVNYYKGKFNAYQRTYVLYDFKEIHVKYLLHYLKGYLRNYIIVHSKKGSIPYITLPMLKEFKLPVPPLEVQCEIVHILDKFTLLTAELTAELTARRKQYEYYRNYILNNVKAEKKELSDVCDFLRGPFGSSLKKEYFKESGYVVYEQQHAIYQKLDFRYFIDADKFSQLKRFEVKPGELIVSCSGTIGKVFVIPENAPKGIINQALLNLKPKDFVKAKYIKYFFENTLGEVLNNSARGGAIKNVPSVGELKKIKIYIPCKDEQKKIISTLDRFDKLCNDITSGIPAEIEVRQKQYEYYRDKLLTFKEKNNE